MAKIGYFESMKRKKKIKDTIANIILAILVVLTLGPIVFMVLTSLMDHNAIARVNGLHLLDSQTMLKSSKNFLSVFISETVLLYVQLLWLWRSLLQRLQVTLWQNTNFRVRFLWYSYSCNAIASWNDVLASSLSRLC